jgi:GNAT superfamily N-acetyltransferase
MVVLPASGADFEAVVNLLAAARSWQRTMGVDVWQQFDPAQIAADISRGCVYVGKAGDALCATVTLLESDPLVWGPDGGRALYIHKLASSRDERGRGAGARIIAWVRDMARQRDKRWLRLETWRENRKMRAYYERQGFRHVRDQFFPPDSALPADYRGTYKSLYQLEL